MSPLELVGGVAADAIEARLDEGREDAGFARFLVSALSDDEVLAIVDAIRARPGLAERIEVALPSYRFGGRGLDPAILTDRNVTALRHEPCAREGRLMVLTDDSQRQSLAQLERIDADFLLNVAAADRWMGRSGVAEGLDETLRLHLKAALQAVIQIDRVPLRSFAHYVTSVAEAVANGVTPVKALGASLLCLDVPRYDDLFEEILPQRRHQPSQWRQRYSSHWKRSNYLAKRDMQQLPLSRTRLREKLDELRQGMDDDLAAVLEGYVAAADGLGPATRAPFAHDWPQLRPFLEEAAKPEKESLGRRTRSFYAEREESLTAEEHAYLENFASNRSIRPERGPEDESFYAAHGREMREEDPRLAALWERFVFGQKVECVDFVDGIVQCMRRLYEPGGSATRRLVVEGIEDRPSSFVSLNDDVGTFFSTIHRGLPEIFENVVEFRKVEAFRYPEIAVAIANWNRRVTDSSARKNRQLSFRVWLETEIDGARQRSAELRLVWEASLAQIGMGLATDVGRLNANRRGTPLVETMAGRRAGLGRNRSGDVDLKDMASLQPTASRDRGVFVPAPSRCVSLARNWRVGLDELLEARLVTAPAAVALSELYDDFEEAYGKALNELQTMGLASSAIDEQAVAYGLVLDRCVAAAGSATALERLLSPILRVGVAAVDQAPGHEPAAVVCPWHPLRLAAARGRLLRCAEALAPLLVEDGVTFTDNGALFFNELRRDLVEPLGPEVVATWMGEKAMLLSTLVSLNGYSLHEPPVDLTGSGGATGGDVRVEARQVADVVDTYLRLQPHERDNLSIVLYNCDAAALPQAVVDAIRSLAGDDAEAMCQVTLRHTDEDRLRDVYRQLVMAQSGEDDLHASEATRDFMSRLRISIMVNQGPTSASDGPPFDIVFCHDVISRQARSTWTETERRELPYSSIRSAEWARRLPVRPGERDAVMLLACPVQPSAGWSHLAALGGLIDVDAGRAPSGRPRVPARMTDVRSADTRMVLEETHRLGQWVVNIDDLLDRRQLLDSGVSVIRHRRGGPGGRSMVISSSASDTLLRSTLRGRLSALDPSLDEAALRETTGRLITDANQMSGDLVLRAARRGANAAELLGVVLSRFLIAHELGADRRAAWLFLDDYAAWLGQDERRMADILCLAPSLGEGGKPCLEVIVTEAKYVGAAGMTSKGAESARQLRDTLARLESALSPSSPPADRRIWRARLADMLIDGMRGQAAHEGDDVDWAAVVRAEGQCEITVRGYSHVFGHGRPEEPPTAIDAFVGVKDTDGEQERYAPESLREIVRAYALGGDPNPVRLRVRGGLRFGSRKSGPDPTPGDGDKPAPPLGPLDGGSSIVAARNASAASDRSAVDGDVRERGGGLAPEDDQESAIRREGRFRSLLAEHAQAQQIEQPDDGWLKDVTARCRNALMRYGMSATVQDSVLTPNSAQLRFQGSDDLTVAKVEARSTELKTTHGIEVLNVLAQPGRVVIVVRRPNRARVLLANAWQDWRTEAGVANSRLMIAVREDDGTPLFLEPQPLPHTLVAGSTGSGKSVLVQNIILGIAATNTSRQARIILIDPKAGVDYFAFEQLPHLDEGIVDQPDAALERLKSLVVEMDRRYQLFRSERVSNVSAYNGRAERPLPTIWLVHDEFADWMQIDSYRSEVEAAVSRLGVKARAAGIYLIFAAQRPDSTVFPMQLRSNLGNRLVLRVDSAGTSDLSLGLKGGGAERLLGQGHLAALVGGGTVPQYAQVPYVDDAELDELVRAIVEDDLAAGAP